MYMYSARFSCEAQWSKDNRNRLKVDDRLRFQRMTEVINFFGRIKVLIYTIIDAFFQRGRVVQSMIGTNLDLTAMATYSFCTGLVLIGF